MMRVALDTATTFEYGTPEPLLDLPGPGGAISPDGTRFLLLKDAVEDSDDPPQRPRLNVVLDWFEELTSRVPVP